MERMGQRKCKIERLLNISKSTIRSLWQKFRTTGNVEHLPCSGIPPKATKRAESRILRGRSLRDTTHYFNTGYAVNVRHKTVQRILHSNKVFRQVLRKMVIKEVNRRKRFSWCLTKRKWLVQNEWKQRIFSDD